MLCSADEQIGVRFQHGLGSDIVPTLGLDCRAPGELSGHKDEPQVVPALRLLGEGDTWTDQ